ncbi:hypothetical protein F3Y22_tig00001478pilonHSYRG00382 [Hibiscus syriacus]|uniref:RNase H type-1 domain-containing protein n=1 Tax=Hibiscus syriacus TaxID=106335 RepID=A0A6A3D1Q4_HIBSY|nr:hypothetical protein F3Y22_tig00001478pilonHSYRG00382 [Hibiscus syriacus]
MKELTKDNIMRVVSSFLQEWDASSTRRTTSPTRPNGWQPPPHGLIKIKLDASFYHVNRQSFSGIIFKNNGLIMVVTYLNPSVPSPEMAEAIACSLALRLAEDLSFRRLLVEGDALTVILKINSISEDRSDICPIISNIKERNRSFELITFMHVPRKMNNPTHVLAEVGKTFTNPMVWIEETPPAMKEAAVRDKLWVDPPN